MTDWRPIDTAPKDGRMILLLRMEHPGDYYRGPEITVGYWGDRAAGYAKSDKPGNYIWLDWTVGLIDDDKYGEAWAVVNAPTHWMPIPARPNIPTWTGQLYVRIEGRKRIKHIVVGILDGGMRGQFRSSFEVPADQVNAILSSKWLDDAVMRFRHIFWDELGA